MVVAALGEDSNATGVDGNQDNNSATTAGTAYVFVRDAGGVWSQQAYLKASNTDSGDSFGLSVSISGDTVVVGAPNEDGSGNSAPFAGAAYVFFRSSTTWSHQAFLKASNTDGGDQFGVSVAVSGDIVVVGAPGEDSSATGVDGNQADNTTINAGAAYVFARNAGGGWSQRAYLKASNTDNSDSFGRRVAVSGSTVMVGAPVEASNATGVGGDQADNSAFEAGAAYVFVLPDCNNNGVPDATDIANGTSFDVNTNGVPDECDPDCNTNGIPDDLDITNGPSMDVLGAGGLPDGIPDECQADCNGNFIPDDLDITTGPSQDCDNNGIPDECEPDGDGDGTIDDCDDCPNDPNKTTFGACGCGVSDVDTDSDGVADCLDNCPNDPNKLDPGQCDCGNPDTDSDGDGVADCLDNCPTDPTKLNPGFCGCGFADADSDGDGIPDCTPVPGTNPGPQPNPGPQTNPSTQQQLQVFFPVFPPLLFPICGIGLIVPMVAVATGIWTMRRRRRRHVARNRSGR